MAPPPLTLVTNHPDGTWECIICVEDYEDSLFVANPEGGPIRLQLPSTLGQRRARHEHVRPLLARRQDPR